MILEKNEKNLKEYEAFVEKCPKGHFAQTGMWAKLKDNWKNEIVVSRDKDGNINGVMSVLIRNLSPKKQRRAIGEHFTRYIFIRLN